MDDYPDKHPNVWFQTKINMKGIEPNGRVSKIISSGKSCQLFACLERSSNELYAIALVVTPCCVNGTCSTYFGVFG